VGHWQLRGFGLWAVAERDTGLLAGRVGCWQPEGWPGLEIGWTLRRRFWGRGYATEAALAALEYAFARLGQERVISLIRPDNGPSIAVALRLGMHVQEYTQVMGHPVVMYGIDRHSSVPV